MGIDIQKAFQVKPPPQDYVIWGFVAGSVGCINGAGGIGKSILVMQMAAGIACDVAGGDTLGLGIQNHGSVVYYNLEDPESEIIRRLHAFGSRLSQEAREAVAERLIIEPLTGKMFNVCKEKHRDAVIKHCQGIRLIVFDTLSRIHRLDENNNGDMANLICVLEYIARETGASVMFLHHISKLAALNGLADLQQASRGAGAIIDNVRWAGYLVEMNSAEAEKFTANGINSIGEENRGHYVRFGWSKQNYGVIECEKWYRRSEGGILQPYEIVELKKQGNGKSKKDPAPCSQENATQDQDPFGQFATGKYNGGAW